MTISYFEDASTQIVDEMFGCLMFQTKSKEKKIVLLLSTLFGWNYLNTV